MGMGVGMGVGVGVGVGVGSNALAETRHLQALQPLIHTPNTSRQDSLDVYRLKWQRLTVQHKVWVNHEVRDGPGDDTGSTSRRLHKVWPPVQHAVLKEKLKRAWLCDVNVRVPVLVAGPKPSVLISGAGDALKLGANELSASNREVRPEGDGGLAGQKQSHHSNTIQCNACEWCCATKLQAKVLREECKERQLVAERDAGSASVLRAFEHECKLDFERGSVERWRWSAGRVRENVVSMW